MGVIKGLQLSSIVVQLLLLGHVVHYLNVCLSVCVVGVHMYELHVYHFI